MNSFIETNEQTVIDFNTIHAKVPQHSKSYTFFLYYVRKPSQNSTHIQRLAFKLKEEKGWGWDKQDGGRLVHLFFVDLENQIEIDQSFLDLKMQLLEGSKLKLIFYAQEQHLISTLDRAQGLGIELSQVPAALYSTDLYGDLSQHLGWQQAQLGNFSQLASNQFEQSVRKWISSPGQKIDLWQVTITVDPQQGNIYKLQAQTNNFVLAADKTIKQQFLSHLSIGHHAQLAANYETRRKQNQHSLMNRFIFGFQSLKKFCCLGKPSLEASTGIFEMQYHDQKGHKQEITKEIGGKQNNKRGVMTLLLSNIDRFQGIKLKGGRLSDGKLQMRVFQSKDEWRLVGSPTSEILLKFKANEIFVQVNSSCLRLVKPVQMRIVLQRKMKVLINKQTLQC